MEDIIEKAEYCLNCKIKPCNKSCPLENDIPAFIKLVKEKEYEKAFNVLLDTTVLMPICGRICPHEKQCQGSCVRGIKSNPVSIGELEAFIGDMALENDYKIRVLEEPKKEKIAIIGGGPAGITAAVYLVRRGYNVTIYEKHSKLGGLLRHGIPEFRLEKELLDKWLEKLINLGIKVQYNCELGKDIKIEQLLDEYDAVLLSFGANISSKMNIEGEQLDGVYGGNELLEKALHPDYKNKKVAVIGGGNVAMDTARTIKRMGAKEVNIIYRRAEKQMPAEKKEIQDVKNEGINLLFQTNIVKILGQTEVEKIECIKTKLIKKEDEHREVPVNIEGSNELIDIDYVVMAVGSETEKAVVENLGVGLTKWGYIKIDEEYKTTKEKVFAAGDLAGTKATVAWAARSGKNVARAIVDFFK